jgi:hypothetical protein
MPYVYIHAHIPEPLDTNTSDSICKYVKHLDDNLRYFGEKLSQFHCELAVKRLKKRNILSDGFKYLQSQGLCLVS